MKLIEDVTTLTPSSQLRWDCHGRLYAYKLSTRQSQMRAVNNRQIDFYRWAADVVTRPVSFEAVSRSLSLPYGGTGHPPMLHFVRFTDDRYHNAVKTFGRPDFIHRLWDHRAVAEVMPGDVVVFAEGDEHQPISPHAYDDSAFF